MDTEEPLILDLKKENKDGSSSNGSQAEEGVYYSNPYPEHARKKKKSHTNKKKGLSAAEQRIKKKKAQAKKAMSGFVGKKK